MTQTHPLWQYIRTVPDFPKTGIDFYDITPLLDGHLNELVDALILAVPDDIWAQADCLVAVEARGFVLASLLAARLNKHLALVRKKGKLPPPVHQLSYGLEYGTDTLEIGTHINPSKVLIIDDVLATGGTLGACVELCKTAGHEVLGALILLDLTALHGVMPFRTWTVLEKA